MKRIKILLGMVFLLSSMSFATGFQFNVAGKQMPASEDVSGLRLNLFYGKTTNMTGLDINILALGETDNFTGLQLSPFSLGANKVNNSFKGAGFGLVNIHGGESTGAIFGLVNMTHNVKGLQWGAVNISDGRSTVNLGLVNISQSSAFQMGLFNMTNDLTGVQLGLINMAKTGFLPIFPFFNIDGRIF
ncbi:VC2662 family protein [Psychrilyobacter atlanticus]|uniref:VC2662 family protein n=1 Tax=Psychrilyobacter atlanticus TaxID=271091 RepID=UPI0003F87095|nr:hypothetical protein [Psychrilyobacter atlanticus]